MNEIEKAFIRKVVEELIEIEREKMNTLIEIKRLIERFVEAYDEDIGKVKGKEYE